MTYEAIMERMLSRVPGDLDKREGSVIWDALAPAAVELQLLYIELQDVMDEAFADTASREYLIRRAAERGISPYKASAAVLRGEFSPETVQVLGQRFTLGALRYVVTEAMGGGAYKVACETVGAEGGRFFGPLIPVDYIEGLESARLVELLIPGEDAEETERLRARYFASFDAKAYGGNVRDYVEKVNALPGVGGVKVSPVWNGGGTVLLTLIDSAYRAASAALVEAVQEEIDPTRDGGGQGVAPIGHVVTVRSVRETVVDIAMQVQFAPGYDWDSAGTAAVAAVESYMEELRRGWAGEEQGIVRIAQVETRVLSVMGIVDVGGTAINGAQENLTLEWDEIPVLGRLTPE